MRPNLDGVRELSSVADWIVFGEIVVSAVVVAAYLFFYLWRPWYSNAQGRALMTKAVGNVILLDALALPYAIFGDYPGRPYVRLVGMTIFMAGVTYLLVSMLTSPGARDYPPRSWLRRREDVRR
jgi:hypothetical protein